MSLTQEQIKHIANLSRLDLNSTDLSKYSEDLNSIVDYIDKLNEIDNEKFI
jgi:aspartyl-tRNA(Asn)/glutamyl-tRNA(Gln) amidotransferase subunit C